MGWAPVEPLKDGGDVVGGGSWGEDMCRRILVQLQFVEGLLRKAKKERDA